MMTATSALSMAPALCLICPLVLEADLLQRAPGAGGPRHIADVVAPGEGYERPIGRNPGKQLLVLDLGQFADQHDALFRVHLAFLFLDHAVDLGDTGVRGGAIAARRIVSVHGSGPRIADVVAAMA